MSAENPGALWAALAAAQSRAKRVEHDKRNNHHRYDYASSEAILMAATEAMTGTGLGLLPVGYTLDGDQLSRSYLLTHESGQSHPISQVWPITSRKGSDRDKALAGALTSSLAYMLRDLLMMPRVEPGTDSLHDERQAAPVERKHHPSFKDDRRAFMAALNERGLSYDKHVAPFCEEQQWGRPSGWPAEQRRKFISDIDAGKLPGLMERASS